MPKLQLYTATSYPFPNGIVLVPGLNPGAFGVRKNPTHAEYEMLTQAAAAAVTGGQRSATVSGTSVPSGYQLHFGSGDGRVTVTAVDTPSGRGGGGGGMIRKKLSRVLLPM